VGNIVAEGRNIVSDGRFMQKGGGCWDFGMLGLWDVGTLGYWDFEIMKFR
jgi:hypothetical protein